MKIGKISEVTKIYHSSKGNDFCLVKLEMTDIDECLKDSYNPVMFGTISYKDIDESGRLTKKINLLSMCLAKTIPEAIQEREDEEAIEGMTLEEVIKYFKSKK